MESIYLLIPLVLAFTLVALLIYIWAVNNGQYDDLDKDAEQLLFDKDDVRENSKPILTPPSLRTEIAPAISGIHSIHGDNTSPTEQGRLKKND